jgi:DNA-binding SARP family transcriptional activator
MSARRLIRVLGPIDVLTPDGPRNVGGEHVRTLLGALVVGAGRAVPTTYLADVLWGATPPRSADNTLQSYVSRLRSVLGRDAITRTDHAYRLDVDADEIDAARFEALVAEAGDPASGAETRRSRSRSALQLWRGRPFGDQADHEAFRLEAYRLDELRVLAMELAIAADLELGHDELVVGELESLVEEHPYREHAWHLLIEALIGAGRRIEAARACGRLREQLEDAGISPGHELEELEHRVLHEERS